MFGPPSRYYFCRNIIQFDRKLAAGRRADIIGRAIVLQKLIHCLQCLIVLIEDLQVLHRGRGLRAWSDQSRRDRQRFRHQR